jgi:hypothetical protein
MTEPEPLTAEELADEMSEAWTTVERAIWPDGPARGHGSGVYAGLKARIIATLDAERAAHTADRERIAAVLREAQAMADEQWGTYGMHPGAAYRTLDRAVREALRSPAATEPPAQPAPEGELDVARLGLSAEQTGNLRDHLASRQQPVSEFLGDVLMEIGLGRATGKEYPPPARLTAEPTPEPES